MAAKGAPQQGPEKVVVVLSFSHGSSKIGHVDPKLADLYVWLGRRR
jgi:hypothetical protein